MLETSEPILIDPWERNDYDQRHRAGAVNMPLEELQSRATIELSRSQPVVVDCHQGSEPICNAAAQLLTPLGFPDVVIFVHE